MRAESPEPNARENWWYYSQSGPGVYAGDVHYYSNDWDGREDARRIDTSLCKVSLLTGEYDYSCTPDMTRAVAAADSRFARWSSWKAWATSR